MNYKYIKYTIPILIIIISFVGNEAGGLMTSHDLIQYGINILIALAIIINIKIREEFKTTNQKEVMYPRVEP